MACVLRTWTFLELLQRRPFDFYGYALPCNPTSAPPGSKAKLRVLRERYRKRQNLFNDDDAKTTARQAFTPGKDPGPRGDVYRKAMIEETGADAGERYQQSKRPSSKPVSKIAVSA